MKGAKPLRSKLSGTVTLKAVAQHLGLTPGTVSAVLINSRAARSIPENTRKRIIDAARELNYQPNLLARSLRVQRTFTVGVIAEEIGDTYGSSIVSGIEPYLRDNDFFFLTVAHRHDPKLLQTYSQLLVSRGVEGIITIDTSIVDEPTLPTVAVAGHQKVDNVTNIILDHRRAAELGLRHLKELGHERIAFFCGQPKSSDSATRWEAIQEAAREFEIRITPGLVPEDISVMGFDDISISSFSMPPLTTIRQPLEKMGRIAAQTLLDRIKDRAAFVPEITVEPELISRRSVGPARKS